MFKKLVSLLTIAVAGLFLSGVASAAIGGSAHDFGSAGFNSADGRICIVCHAAHAPSNMATGAPLWNHELTVKSDYTLYTGFDLQGTVTQPLNPGSKLCLSCHDGTVAVDSFGGTTGSTTISGAALVGVDLSNDHPISIDYDVADLGLNITSTAVTFSDSTSTTILAGMLFGGNVECASCHDVHNATSVNAPKLLRVTNDGSQLCTTCHKK